MSKVTAAIAVGLISAMPLPAHAQQEPRSAQYQSCMRLAGNEMQLHQCVSDEIARQDSILNATYKQTMSALDPDRKSKLLESERLWIKFRDATCDALASAYAGGSMEGRVFGQCSIDQTIRRVRDLKAIYAEGREE